MRNLKHRRTGVQNVLQSEAQRKGGLPQLATGRYWAAIGGKDKDLTGNRALAAYSRTDGVRHLSAACDLTRDRLFGHVRPTRSAPSSWSPAATCAAWYPPDVHIAIACDNYSPHLSTGVDQRVADWVAPRQLPSEGLPRLRDPGARCRPVSTRSLP